MDTTTPPTTDPSEPLYQKATPSIGEALQQAHDTVRSAIEQDQPAATTAAYPVTSFEAGAEETRVRLTPVDDLDESLQVLQGYTGVGLVGPLRLIAGNVRIERDAIATERDQLAGELRTVVGKLHHARAALLAADAGLALAVGVDNAVGRALQALDQRDAYITELEKLLLEDPKTSAAVTTRTMRTKIAAAKAAAAPDQS